MADGIFTYKQLAEFWGMPNVGDSSQLPALPNTVPGGKGLRSKSSTGSDLYREFQGRFYFMPAKLGGLELWLPMVRITGRKKIVETDLVERRGSVKEIITQQDYMISIRGVIKRADNNWPDEELAQLRDLVEQNKSLPLQCAMTDIFLNSPRSDGFDHVVVQNFQVMQRAGFPAAVGYELELIEDNDFLLIEPEEV